MYITEQIVKRYSWLVTFTKVVIRELKTLTPMPLLVRIKMWWGGFFSAAWFRYEFNVKVNQPEHYVSDYQENLRASKINKSNVSIYVDNKIIFPLFFGKFGPVVNNIAFISNGKVVPQSNENRIASFNDLIDLSKQFPLIVKPVDGSRGGKIHTIRYSTNGLLHNDQTIDIKSLTKLLSSLNFNIVSPLIKQAEYSNKFYPKTTNTIRILTLIDPGNNEAFIAHAVQRVGTKHSFPVDNFAVGGITFDVDIKSGVLGKGSYIIPTESKKTWYSKHPETGEQIEGVQIPNWNGVCHKILEIAQSVSFLKIIGWDLIITDTVDGFVLLEGNNGPCFKVHQLHGGFLQNPRIKNFMRYYKVIR